MRDESWEMTQEEVGEGGKKVESEIISWKVFYEFIFLKVFYNIYFEEYQNMFNLFSQLQLLSTGLWFAYFTIHISRTTHWITLKF